MLESESRNEGSDQDDMNTLRILSLNKRSWKHSKAGGSELNLEETLKQLAERGHQVHLLVGSDEGRNKTEVEDSVTIHRVGVGNHFSAPWDVVLSYLTVSVYFYWYLYQLSPDVVYTVNTPLPWPVMTLRPRVAIFHHIAIDSFFNTHPFPQNLLGVLSQWFGVLRERKTPTVSVSPSTTEELISRGHDPETVHEIRNGLNLGKYEPGSEAPSPRIVYVGGLERYKGVDRIPKIHQSLQELAGSPIQLEVAGRDGPLGNQIAEYCRKTEYAKFHGFISEEKKIELLQSAWIFIAPSRVEGWGIAVLEANACGTPAVGSDVKGLRDSIIDEQTGLLAKGSDPELFAGQINRLLVDDDKRDTFRYRARDWAEKHSWEHTVDQLEELFLSVASVD